MDNHFDNEKKTVAIIGGGAGGLVSCKSCLENNLLPTLFEREVSLGGVWDENNSKVWNSLKTTISKLSIVFSDFPYKDDEKSKNEFFLTPPQLYKYLYDYAQHFNLINHIQFNSCVIGIEKIENQDKWKIQWKDTRSLDNGDDNIIIKERIFDYVLVCSGVNNKPAKFDKFDLLKKFKGNVIHSKQYKSPIGYEDKRVLIIGHSESSLHISTDLSNHAKSVHQLIRGSKDKWIVGRDVTISLGNGNSIKVPIDFYFYIRNQNYSTQSLSCNEYFKFLNSSFQKLSNNNQDCEQLQFSKSFESAPPYSIISNDEYIPYIKEGKIQLLKGFNITNVENNSITFELLNDNSNFIDLNHFQKKLEFDEVILCNGYNADFSFLDKEIIDDIELVEEDYNQPCILYKGIFPKSLKGIAFIGIYNTPYYTTLELSARFACLVFSGKKKLPNKDEIYKDLKEQYEIRNSNIKNQHFTFVDHVIHSDKLAKEIDCLPDFEEIRKTDIQLYQMLWNGLFCNACYRLQGPNSNPSLSKKTLNYYYSLYQKTIIVEK